MVKVLGNACCRGVGAVRSAEGIVDESIGCGQCSCKLGIVLFFASVEAHVFEKKDFALTHFSHFGFNFFANAVFHKGDGLAERLANSSATGARVYLAFFSRLGRPRWDTRITLAPCSTSNLIVGSAATIRESSLIMPSLRGTLKSQRTKTRLPERLTSLMVLVAMAFNGK